MKHPAIFETFIRMNIDVNPSTKKRPQSFYQVQQALDIKITKVPTVITPNAEYVLSDVDAFKWLEHQIRLLTTEADELKPFNPNEMGSFSDNYSNFGSTDLCDAKEQSFKFFDKGMLSDDNFLQTNKAWDPKNTNGFLDGSEEPSKIDYSSKQNERQFFDESRQKPNSNFENNFVQQTNDNVDISAKYNNQKAFQQRQSTQQQPQQRKNINFTDPNFGLAGQMNNSGRSNGKSSQKGKEMDIKLEQLMNDRDSMNNSLSQRQQFH
jgi:hypothetical protein